jgi:hypothetical protein
VRAALEIAATVERASSTEDLSVRVGIATGLDVNVMRKIRGQGDDVRIE